MFTVCSSSVCSLYVAVECGPLYVAVECGQLKVAVECVH